MRVLHMAAYHWRRQRMTALFFTALMLVISTATLFFIRAEYATTMVTFRDGVPTVAQGYGTLRTAFNYSALFTLLLWATTVVILRQERNFFITASSSRWEFLLGLVSFTVLYALILTAAGWLVGVLNRLSLLLLGMKVRESWSLGLILSGGDPALARTLLLNFTGMLTAAGYASLIYMLFARWWKQILVLMGTGIIIMIVLGVQISLGAYTQSMVDTARRVANWLEEVFIPTVAPWLERVFAEDRLWVLVLRDLGQAVICFALTYPVMLRMKVK